MQLHSRHKSAQRVCSYCPHTAPWLHMFAMFAAADWDRWPSFSMQRLQRRASAGVRWRAASPPMPQRRVLAMCTVVPGYLPDLSICWNAVEVIDGEEVIADFYGGETKHGLALRLHAGPLAENRNRGMLETWTGSC